MEGASAVDNATSITLLLNTAMASLKVGMQLYVMYACMHARMRGYRSLRCYVWNSGELVARQMMGLRNPVYLYVNRRRPAFAKRAIIYTDLHKSTLSYIALAAGEQPFARIHHVT